MAQDSREYNWSDAWLLLAIIYAERYGEATPLRVIAAGDFIEHAIFNPDELESGLARLTSGGYIDEKAGVFSLTDKVMGAYEKTTSRRELFMRSWRT